MNHNYIDFDKIIQKIHTDEKRNLNLSFFQQIPQKFNKSMKSFRKNTRNCLQGHTGTVKTIAVTIDNKYVISGS